MSEYGWHILLVLVCVGIVWVKLGPAVRKWWAKKKEREEELNFGEHSSNTADHFVGCLLCAILTASRV